MTDFRRIFKHHTYFCHHVVIVPFFFYFGKSLPFISFGFSRISIGSSDENTTIVCSNGRLDSKSIFELSLPWHHHKVYTQTNFISCGFDCQKKSHSWLKRLKGYAINGSLITYFTFVKFALRTNSMWADVRNWQMESVSQILSMWKFVNIKCLEAHGDFCRFLYANPFIDQFRFIRNSNNHNWR